MQGVSSQITQNYHRAFSKNCRLVKDSASKQTRDESILDHYERFKETFKQYYGMTPESFFNHQDDSLLNSIFLEGLDEESAALNDTI